MIDKSMQCQQGVCWPMIGLKAAAGPPTTGVALLPFVRANQAARLLKGYQYSLSPNYALSPPPRPPPSLAPTPLQEPAGAASWPRDAGGGAAH